MKGVMLGINPEVSLVDVTHEIEPFSILEGALVMKGIAGCFPEGTIHTGVIDPGVGSERRGIVVRCDGRLYVGPDNGLFSLIMRHGSSRETRFIENPEFMRPNPHPTFHGRDVFAPVAAHLSLGKPFSDVGATVENPVMFPFPEPTRMRNGVRGEIIHVDRFGTLVSNIDAALLDEPVDAVVAGAVLIKGIGRYFGQVDEGEPIALINSSGYLEIAVNRGDAAAQLGMGKGRSVEIVWNREKHTGEQ
jgi:S-adenosylmethionine hydrolase